MICTQTDEVAQRLAVSLDDMFVVVDVVVKHRYTGWLYILYQIIRTKYTRKRVQFRKSIRGYLQGLLLLLSLAVASVVSSFEGNTQSEEFLNAPLAELRL